MILYHHQYGKKRPRFRSLALCQCFGGFSLLGCLLRLRMSFDWGTQRQAMPCRGRHAIFPLPIPCGATIGSLVARWSMRRWTSVDLQMSSVVVASVSVYIYIYGYTLLHRELAMTLSPSCCFLWEPADDQSNACVASYEPRGAMQGDALIQTQQDIKSMVAYLSSSTVCKSLCQMRIWSINIFSHCCARFCPYLHQLGICLLDPFR